MTSVLVTGGAGYIGSHTCKALRLAGYDPVTYDNLGRGNPEAVQWGALEIGELSERARLREAFERYRPDAVIHLAAMAYVNESNLNPTLYYHNNVAGTAVCDDWIVIDLSAMRGVRVDPAGRSAWVQGGALWGDVDRETQAHGLATTGGIVSHTGVAGLTRKKDHNRAEALLLARYLVEAQLVP